MRTILLAHALLLSMLASMPAAALPPELLQKAELLNRQAGPLFKQAHKWESVQQAMLKQKQDIEAAQDEINRESTALGEKSSAHNRQVALQQQRLKESKTDCASGGNDSGRTESCNDKAQSLNAQTADINAENGALNAEQAALDAKYAKANQDASDWNAREQLVVQNMNASYRALNDWLDHAYGVISDSDFRDAVSAAGVDGVCENRGLPDSMSIATQRKLGLYYRNCLKTVLAARPAAAPVAATH